MLDPTLTHRLTTAAAPEWAAEVTVGVPKMLAEIRKVRDEVMTLGRMLADRENLIAHYEIETAGLREELADVKAECCRLVCHNGDLDKLVTVRGNGMTSLEARVKELTDRNGDLEAELGRLKNVLRESIVDHISLAGDYEECGNTRGAMQLRAAANLLGCIFQGGTPATVCPPATEIAAREQS